MAIYMLLGLSLNLLVGYSALLSLAQAAFFGIGAYSFTLCLTQVKAGFLASLFLGTVFNMLLAYGVGRVSLIFKEDFFVLVTMGFQVIMISILNNWTGLTRGPYGISGIPRPSVFGYELQSIPAFLVLTVLIVAPIIVYARVLDRSAFCLYLKGIRDNQLAFVSSGKDPAHFKIVSFTISGGIAGIAGALYASYMSYIDPTSFSLEESIFIVSVIMIGGTGNIRGPLAGTFIMLALPEALRLVGLPGTIAPNIRQIFFGILLVILMRFRPQGVLGEYKFD